MVRLTGQTGLGLRFGHFAFRVAKGLGDFAFRVAGADVMAAGASSDASVAGLVKGIISNILKSILVYTA